MGVTVGALAACAGAKQAHSRAPAWLTPRVRAPQEGGAVDSTLSLTPEAGEAPSLAAALESPAGSPAAGPGSPAPAAPDAPAAARPSPGVAVAGAQAPPGKAGSAGREPGDDSAAEPAEPADTAPGAVAAGGGGGGRRAAPAAVTRGSCMSGLASEAGTVHAWC